ncbi:MAG TPA: ADP-forming succinate--CoA ligase subunit beta [Thermoleophilia bacterium]|nr:ADP-forming succinate--CoA ligase subunit beta [Thermoleophilia bacterium]
MDLLEHQGKRLFAEAGLPVLPSATAATISEAQGAAANIGLPVVIKAQVKTGGRGKAGGVRICRTPEEVAAVVPEVLGMTIHGRRVASVLVEQAVDIDREMYLAIAASRAERGPVLVFSRFGGVDIEEVARDNAEAIVRRPLDPLLGPVDYQVRDVLVAAALEPAAATSAGRPLAEELAAVVHALWRLYRDRDATLVEINPLVLTARGDLVCLDSKITIDDNALYRQPDLAEARVEDEAEARARQAGISYVSLDGDIGVIGNGAGLVMSTLDQIAAAGGSAADFCDIGGGGRAEVVTEALTLIMSSQRVNAILVSIFGGMTRGDEVARGLLEALAAARLDVPVVLRLDGNTASKGRAILVEANVEGLAIAASASEAVRLVVAAARERAVTATRAEA